MPWRPDFETTAVICSDDYPKVLFIQQSRHFVNGHNTWFTSS
ncbi:hypothetical protein [Candidatus Symbiopectobacterium sp.]|nr:hypothetical protein [Candidatus Symbiopectobacterium sp.]